MVDDDPCKFQCCKKNLDGTDSLLQAEEGVCSQLPISPAEIFVTTTSNFPVTRSQQYSNTELLLQAALDGDTEAVQRLFAAGADLASYRHQAESVDEEPKKMHIVYPHTDYQVSNILYQIPLKIANTFEISERRARRHNCTPLSSIRWTH